MHPSLSETVVKRVLDNGMTVLVREYHSSPVVAVLAHVGVGYFHEPDRWNGISHVVEHMLFKGTESRPTKEQIARDVRAIGGTINAGTYYDETTYYIVAPSAQLGRAMEIQADAVQRSRFDAVELGKEIEVIIQESHQKRDNPSAMLTETLYAHAYDRHRIRRWRIGPDDVLRSLQRDDLVQFVGQTYRPGNIVLTVVGDVEPEHVFELAQREWGGMDTGRMALEKSPSESGPPEFRFDRMVGDVQQRLFQFGFQAPPLLHPDSAPLMVLGALLSDGRSARLYRRVKEEQRLVSSAWAGYEGFEDIGVFTLGGESSSDDPIDAERATVGEVRLIQAEGVQEQELRRIQTRIETRRLYGQEEALGMARHLASYEALGGYSLADEVLEKLRAVTSEDVARVAAEYVQLDRATLQEYVPVAAVAPDRAAADVLGRLRAASPAGDRPVTTVSGYGEESALANGESLVFRRRDDLPIVAIHVLFPGGRLGESVDTSGITNLLLKSMLKGAGGMDAEEIALRIESLGSSIGTSITNDYIGFSLKVIATRIDEGIEVLRAVISDPEFPEDEVRKEKDAIEAEIRRQLDSMPSRAVDLFNAACWGEQPYGLPSSGILSAIESVTISDLRDWHRRWIRSGAAIIGVVGDISVERLSELLHGLIPVGAAQEQDSARIDFLSPGERSVDVDKRQTASVLGFQGAMVSEDSRHALDVISEITSGLAGRFFQAVRGERGLAYAVSSFHRARRLTGTFATYTATSPENEEMARDLLLDECRKLRDDPVRTDELESAKVAIRGERITSLQTFSSQAGELAVNRLYGLPIDAGDRYIRRIDTLTAEELREAARTYLRSESAWMGVVRGQRSVK